MEVVILEGGITAKDENSSKVYKVKGITLRGDKNNPTFYDNESKFFRVACPSGTKHSAEIVDSNTVMLH